MESAAAGDEEVASPAETRAALLHRAGQRNFTPIANFFVQQPQGSASRPGPLGEFVRNGDKRGLLALLLILAVNSSGAGKDGWTTTLPLPVWARALNTTSDATGKSATAAVTKIFGRLVTRKLITRTRVGVDRQVRVGPLREDGSGEPYSRPTSKFLKLSHDFWRDGWHDKLDLPAIAMLLVALHERTTFALPTERVPEWYGWSADTAERGFTQLVDRGLLTKTPVVKKAPLSPTGSTSYNVYQLTTTLAPPSSTKKTPTRRRASARRKVETSSS